MRYVQRKPPQQGPLRKLTHIHYTHFAQAAAVWSGRLITDYLGNVPYMIPFCETSHAPWELTLLLNVWAVTERHALLELHAHCSRFVVMSLRAS